MKLKMDDAGHVVVSDGKPVYVGDDGKEIAFDAPSTVSTIARITEESKGFKTRAQTAEQKLQAFEGIDDPAAAKQALKTVANLKDKDLVDAGEVERVKQAAIDAVEAKYKPVVDERDTLRKENKAEKLGNAFGKSKTISDKLILPADAAQKLFGDHFEVEGGKIIAKDRHGNVINSKSRPGDPADFDEAMEALIDGYAHKDSILKGTGNRGDGARGGNGGHGGEDLSSLPPAARITAARAAQANNRR